MKTLAKGILRRTGLLMPAYRARQRWVPSERAETARMAGEARALLGAAPDGLAPALASVGTTARAFVVGGSNPSTAALQAPLMAALRLAGYAVEVMLPAPVPALEDLYRKLGATGFRYVLAYMRPGAHPDTGALMQSVANGAPVIGLSYRDIPVGKFALSSLMRRTRRAAADLLSPAGLETVRETLSSSLRYTDAYFRIVDEARPDIVCFIDRGYTPDGELFEVTLQRGAAAITMNTAHRSGYLILKRYGPHNRARHPVTLSPDSWTGIRGGRWSEERWQELYRELAECYRSGQWYDEVGTQFGKRIIDGEALVAELGLDPSKKTAVLFAHMFWDATFFYGRDIFSDYEDWFVESLKAAAANDRLNWIVKIHPANLVKSQRDGYAGEHVEEVAVRRTLGELPPHIKLLSPETPISTFSLFDFMDYCITVRGTVGIEAACFGVPVITAGTGRYDGLGFTVDHQGREDYLATLGRLETLEPPDAGATELARRFAWGILISRPVKLETIRFFHVQDEKASLRVEVDPAMAADPANAPDIAAIRAWLESGDDDMLSAAL